METLPVEMVGMIVRQLTPQDLARCSAVCREWREILNQDCMWKPHCDPELEEPLRTIPCLATPAFVAPELENSTLSPISYWKLAFMRENHLWNNWRSKEMMDKNEHVTVFDKHICRCIDVDFLTDTLVVVWHYNRIEIVDVSVVPIALMAKTEKSVNIGNPYYDRKIIGSTMLLVENIDSIQVLNVDISNGTIKLKHIIPLTYNDLSAVVSKDPFYICWDDKGPKHKIIYLNTGKLLKEEPSPVKITENERVHYREIKSSLTSDFVACEFVVKNSSNGKEYFKYYIYSVEQLAFLPGPVAVYERSDLDLDPDFALLGHWLAITHAKTLQVLNFQTGDVIFSHKLGYCLKIETCNDCFVSLAATLDESEQELYKLCIYFPSNKSLTTLCEMSDVDTFRIINNKFIELSHGLSKVSVWKLSGQAVEKCDFTVSFGYKANRSFTKVLNRNFLLRKCTWAINHVW